jgi:hypothetical protein
MVFEFFKNEQLHFFPPFRGPCPVGYFYGSPTRGLLPHSLPFSLPRRRVLEERVEVSPAGGEDVNLK